MDYESAMGFIASTYKFGSKLGLTRIRDLLGHMDNPQRGLKYVHVAGTNGKGSTVSFISNILMSAGYKTGIYTSPYIHKFNERITVNGRQISSRDIGRIVGIIKDKIQIMESLGQGWPTEFELVTALGFQYYREQNCDIVVLETGLGGRLDSTNVIDEAEVSVITSVDYDHMNILGHSLQEIAAEKAGIVKENGRLVLYPQSPETGVVIERICREKNARLYKPEGGVSIRDYDITGQSFDFGKYENLRLSMLAEFQTINAATAIMTAEVLRGRGFNISDESIRYGLLNTRWPGRFEVLRSNPVFVADAAHNSQGAEHLALNLKRYFPGNKITFIIGVLADKDFKSLVGYAAPLAKRFIVTEPPSPRALKAEKLAEYIRGIHKDVEVEAQPSNAVERALALCGEKEVICSFGSIFYLGAVREAF